MELRGRECGVEREGGRECGFEREGGKEVQSTTLYGDAISHACVKKVQRSREREGIRGHLL